MNGDMWWLTAAEWSALRLSLLVGVLATALVAVPGVLLGWLLARKQFAGKVLVDVLVHLPLVLTPVVVGYLLLLVVGRASPVGAWLAQHGIAVAFALPGAVLASAVVALPLMVRCVRTAVELIDPTLEQVAAVHGAGPLRRFMRITIPLAMPGVMAGLVLAFARSLGEFGATITLAGSIPGETRTLPVAVHAALQHPDGDATAWKLSLVSLIVSLAALVAADAIERRMRRRRQ
jgi:molybdate transport system permease protein